MHLHLPGKWGKWGKWAVGSGWWKMGNGKREVGGESAPISAGMGQLLKSRCASKAKTLLQSLK